MEKLVQYIANEWATLSAAPATFVLLMVVAGTAVFLVVRWHYSAVVVLKDAQIGSLGERIEAKDEQLQNYRQRLRLVPSDQTVYSARRNESLKQDALRVVAGIRSLIESSRRDDYEIPYFDRPDWQSISEEERNRIWREDTNRRTVLSNERIARYDREFKTDAILLRDELLARLPARFREEKRPFDAYEHPVNPLGMAEVAGNLEKLAKSLPENDGD